jgi:hypothetical protein
MRRHIAYLVGPSSLCNWTGVTLFGNGRESVTHVKRSGANL